MLKLTTSFLFYFLLSFSSLVEAFQVPTLVDSVQDEVQLLSSSARNQVADTLFQLHQKHGPQIQVFITKSLQGEAIEQVAIQVFDQWKLGDAKKDNGILLLIAPNEKKMRIEVGRGLEGDLPDVIAKRIISDVVSPFFKRGEFDLGVVQGVAALGRYLSVSPEQKAQMQQEAQQADQPSVVKKIVSQYFILFIIGAWLLLFFINPTFAIYLLMSVMSGGRGGGGSGGRGGWSGGGGSSAGGGASGDW